MTWVMEHTATFETRDAATAAVEVKVGIGKSARFGFLFDPSGGAVGSERQRRARERLPHYFDWLRVPAEPALSLVDDLLPRHPETLPPTPFCLLVAPGWGFGHQQVEVFVNTAFRRHNELLVRVPSWARFLMKHQPVERWIALQPFLSRLGRVGLIGLETTSTGRRALQVFVRSDRLRGEDLKIIATLAGAPTGELIHLWRSFSPNAESNPGPVLVSIRLAGEERLDVGVTFPARRAGSSAEIRKRIALLARVHGLDTERYLESMEELKQLSGQNPEHTMLGFASDNGQVVLTASLESAAVPYTMSRAS